MHHTRESKLHASRNSMHLKGDAPHGHTMHIKGDALYKTRGVMEYRKPGAYQPQHILEGKKSMV